MLKPISNEFRELVRIKGSWRSWIDFKQVGLIYAYSNGLPSDLTSAYDPQSDTELTLNDLSLLNEDAEATFLNSKAFKGNKRAFYEALSRRHRNCDVWFERLIEIPPTFLGGRLALHFECVWDHAKFWVDGQLLGVHDGTSNQIEIELTALVSRAQTVRVVVCCQRIVAYDTEPPCIIIRDENNQPRFGGFNDLFPEVYLISTPLQYLEDVVISQNLQNTDPRALFHIEIMGHEIKSELLDYSFIELLPVDNMSNRVVTSFELVLEDDDGNVLASACAATDEIDCNCHGNCILTCGCSCTHRNLLMINRLQIPFKEIKSVVPPNPVENPVPLLKETDNDILSIDNSLGMVSTWSEIIHDTCASAANIVRGSKEQYDIVDPALEALSGDFESEYDENQVKLIINRINQQVSRNLAISAAPTTNASTKVTAKATAQSVANVRADGAFQSTSATGTKVVNGGKDSVNHENVAKAGAYVTAHQGSTASASCVDASACPALPAIKSAKASSLRDKIRKTYANMLSKKVIDEHHKRIHASQVEAELKKEKLKLNASAQDLALQNGVGVGEEAGLKLNPENSADYYERYQSDLSFSDGNAPLNVTNVAAASGATSKRLSSNAKTNQGLIDTSNIATAHDYACEDDDEAKGSIFDRILSMIPHAQHWGDYTKANDEAKALDQAYSPYKHHNQIDAHNDTADSAYSSSQVSQSGSAGVGTGVFHVANANGNATASAASVNGGAQKAVGTQVAAAGVVLDEEERKAQDKARAYLNKEGLMPLVDFDHKDEGSTLFTSSVDDDIPDSKMITVEGNLEKPAHRPQGVRNQFANWLEQRGNKLAQSHGSGLVLFSSFNDPTNPFCPITPSNKLAVEHEVAAKKQNLFQKAFKRNKVDDDAFIEAFSINPQFSSEDAVLNAAKSEANNAAHAAHAAYDDKSAAHASRSLGNAGRVSVEGVRDESRVLDGSTVGNKLPKAKARSNNDKKRLKDQTGVELEFDFVANLPEDEEAIALANQKEMREQKSRSAREFVKSQAKSIGGYLKGKTQNGFMGAARFFNLSPMEQSEVYNLVNKKEPMKELGIKLKERSANSAELNNDAHVSYPDAKMSYVLDDGTRTRPWYMSLSYSGKSRLKSNFLRSLAADLTARWNSFMQQTSTDMNQAVDDAMEERNASTRDMDMLKNGIKSNPERMDMLSRTADKDQTEIAYDKAIVQLSTMYQSDAQKYGQNAVAIAMRERMEKDHAKAEAKAAAEAARKLAEAAKANVDRELLEAKAKARAHHVSERLATEVKAYDLFEEAILESDDTRSITDKAAAAAAAAFATATGSFTDEASYRALRRVGVIENKEEDESGLIEPSQDVVDYVKSATAIEEVEEATIAALDLSDNLKVYHGHNDNLAEMLQESMNDVGENDLAKDNAPNISHAKPTATAGATACSANADNAAAANTAKVGESASSANAGTADKARNGEGKSASTTTISSDDKSHANPWSVTMDRADSNIATWDLPQAQNAAAKAARAMVEEVLEEQDLPKTDDETVFTYAVSKEALAAADPSLTMTIHEDGSYSTLKPAGTFEGSTLDKSASAKLNKDKSERAYSKDDLDSVLTVEEDATAVSNSAGATSHAATGGAAAHVGASENNEAGAGGALENISLALESSVKPQSHSETKSVAKAYGVNQGLAPDMLSTNDCVHNQEDAREALNTIKGASPRALDELKLDSSQQLKHKVEKNEAYYFKESQRTAFGPEDLSAHVELNSSPEIAALASIKVGLGDVLNIGKSQPLFQNEAGAVSYTGAASIAVIMNGGAAAPSEATQANSAHASAAEAMDSAAGNESDSNAKKEVAGAQVEDCCLETAGVADITKDMGTGAFTTLNKSKDELKSKLTRGAQSLKQKSLIFVNGNDKELYSKPGTATLSLSKDAINIGVNMVENTHDDGATSAQLTGYNLCSPDMVITETMPNLGEKSSVADPYDKAYQYEDNSLNNSYNLTYSSDLGVYPPVIKENIKLLRKDEFHYHTHATKPYAKVDKAKTANLTHVGEIMEVSNLSVNEAYAKIVAPQDRVVMADYHGYDSAQMQNGVRSAAHVAANAAAGVAASAVVQNYATSFNSGTSDEKLKISYSVPRHETTSLTGSGCVGDFSAYASDSPLTRAHLHQATREGVAKLVDAYVAVSQTAVAIAGANDYNEQWNRHWDAHLQNNHDQVEAALEDKAAHHLGDGSPKTEAQSSEDVAKSVVSSVQSNDALSITAAARMSDGSMRSELISSVAERRNKALKRRELQIKRLREINAHKAVKESVVSPIMQFSDFQDEVKDTTVRGMHSEVIAGEDCIFDPVSCPYDDETCPYGLDCARSASEILDDSVSAYYKRAREIIRKHKHLSEVEDINIMNPKRRTPHQHPCPHHQKSGRTIDKEASFADLCYAEGSSLVQRDELRRLMVQHHMVDSGTEFMVSDDQTNGASVLANNFVSDFSGLMSGAKSSPYDTAALATAASFVSSPDHESNKVENKLSFVYEKMEQSELGNDIDYNEVYAKEYEKKFSSKEDKPKVEKSSNLNVLGRLLSREREPKAVPRYEPPRLTQAMVEGSHYYGEVDLVVFDPPKENSYLGSMCNLIIRLKSAEGVLDEYVLRVLYRSHRNQY